MDVSKFNNIKCAQANSMLFSYCQFFHEIPETNNKILIFEMSKT